MTLSVLTNSVDTLAVVPIVVNAGAAVLPAIIAALASFVALLLKPRELFRACRRRPLVAASVIATIALLGVGVRMLMAMPAPAKPPAAQVDFWDSFALKLINGDSSAGTQASLASHAIGLGRDFSRTAHDGGPSPIELGKTPLWSVELDGYVLTSPAVRGNRVFAAVCIEDITGATSAVFCYDTADPAKPVWRKSANNDNVPFKPFYSSPVVTADGKYLLIGQGLHEDRNCALLCFDAQTGDLLWQSPTELHIESSPAVFYHPKYGDVAVVGCGAIEGPNHQPSGDPGHVIAVQVATGKRLWTFAMPDPESSPAASADGSTVYIGSGFNGSAVLALRSDTDADLAGKPRLLWKTPTPYPATGAVTLIGNTLLIGCGNGDFVVSNPNPKGAVIALDAATGAKLWEQPAADAVLGEIAARGNVVIAPCKSGRILALDLASGRPLWSEPISGDNPVLAGVAFTDTRLYAVSKDGVLAVIDPRVDAPTRILEKIFINDERNPGTRGLCFSSPTVAGGRIYVGSETGGLRCIAGKRLINANGESPATEPASQPADMPPDEPATAPAHGPASQPATAQGGPS